jgi:hypothetical protein
MTWLRLKYLTFIKGFASLYKRIFKKENVLFVRKLNMNVCINIIRLKKYI